MALGPVDRRQTGEFERGGEQVGGLTKSAETFAGAQAGRGCRISMGTRASSS